jgi:hypothetical protein
MLQDIDLKVFVKRQPAVYREKFPQERQIVLSPQLEARIRAQEKAGRLVFEETQRGR